MYKSLSDTISGFDVFMRLSDTDKLCFILSNPTCIKIAAFIYWKGEN